MTEQTTSEQISEADWDTVREAIEPFVMALALA